MEHAEATLKYLNTQRDTLIAVRDALRGPAIAHPLTLRHEAEAVGTNPADIALFVGATTARIDIAAQRVGEAIDAVDRAIIHTKALLSRAGQARP